LINVRIFIAKSYLRKNQPSIGQTNLKGFIVDVPSHSLYNEVMNDTSSGSKRIYQDIIAQFVTMLTEGTLKKGDRLPAERVLTEQMGVSRSSVREALRVMETIGVLEVRPGGGAYVTDLNLAPFINTFAPLITRREGFEIELLELRELFEVKAAELVAQKVDQPTVERLQKIIDEMRTALDDENLQAGTKADIEFHREIFRSSGNKLLAQASEYINSLMEISIKGNRLLLITKRENSVKLLKEHQAIFESIRRGDSEKAKSDMTSHLERVRTIYQQELGL